MNDTKSVVLICADKMLRTIRISRLNHKYQIPFREYHFSQPYHTTETLTLLPWRCLLVLNNFNLTY